MLEHENCDFFIKLNGWRYRIFEIEELNKKNIRNGFLWVQLKHRAAQASTQAIRTAADNNKHEKHFAWWSGANDKLEVRGEQKSK